MLNTSKKRKAINNFYWLGQVYDNGVPVLYKRNYFYLLNQLVAYYKNLIDHIIYESGGKIQLPMDATMLENYLTGYNLNYVGFSGKEHGLNIEGFWGFDSLQENGINIFYNIDSNKKRQRFTKIHETFHFCQCLDTYFRSLFDYLKTESTLPEDVIHKLMEKATDKATAMYLMPNDYFIKKYQEIKDIDELSELFQVSAQSIYYRLKECNLITN